VTALSASNAWAVGEHGADFGGDFSGRTLILHWNGRSWTQAASPDSRVHGVLTGVAAVSARDIWAVGETEADDQPLIFHWNGISWRRVRAPGSGGLFTVAATRGGSAFAVGASRGGKYLAVRWTGTAWQTVPTSPVAGQLSGVAFASASSAWVVGAKGVFTPARSVILHWNGSSLSGVTSPAGRAELIGVALSSARSGWAVGADNLGTRHVRAVIVRWNGAAWTRARLPSPTGASLLVGVTTTGTRGAWAVGETATGKTLRTLIMHWNGRTWKVVPS
jgi:hypothetical protein